MPWLIYTSPIQGTSFISASLSQRLFRSISFPDVPLSDFYLRGRSYISGSILVTCLRTKRSWFVLLVRISTRFTNLSPWDLSARWRYLWERIFVYSTSRVQDLTVTLDYQVEHIDFNRHMPIQSGRDLEGWQSSSGINHVIHEPIALIDSILTLLTLSAMDSPVEAEKEVWYLFINCKTLAPGGPSQSPCNLHLHSTHIPEYCGYRFFPRKWQQFIPTNLLI